MTKETKFALGLIAALMVFAWFKGRGSVTAGDVTVSKKGANVDTAGCPDGFRMRPARGMAKARCVPRSGDGLVS